MTRPARKRNVLIFPGGTEISLEIWRALRHCKEVALYSAGADVSTHAPFVFAHYFVVPSVSEQSWLDVLNRVIDAHHIDYVFPAHDDVIAALAECATEVRAAIVSSPPDTCRIARSKSVTYHTLRGAVPVPDVFPDVDSVPAYPVFVKPDRGQGSQGTYVAHSREELLGRWNDRQRYLLVEYLPGEEYTVDCFSDRDGGLLFSRARQRVRTRSGISMHSRPVQDSVFGEFARAIAARLTFHGAWFFQLKRDRRGDLKLLEVAPRIAGTSVMHQVLGVNFPLLSLYEYERVPIEILPNDVDIEVDRALTNRYRHRVVYEAVYVDLDDTLLLNKTTVNVDLVRFLYQCVNRGIRLVLLTRHAGDVYATLRRYRLSQLFDEVIPVDPAACKVDYITDDRAILIDDSFHERQAAQQRRGILTFDCSMIEMLLDERV